MYWVAHRGESEDAPENTLASVNLAWERGIRAVEIDVHLDADGELIVCHDADTLRTTGAKRIIRETSTAALKALDAGRWRGAQWIGERLPLLSETLAIVPDDGRLFIEIKDEAEDVYPIAVSALVGALAASGLRDDQIRVIAFSPGVLAMVKKAMPGIKTDYLFWVDNDSPGARQRWDKIVETALSIGASGLAMGWQGLAKANGVERARAAGLDAHVWTVDDVAIAAEVIAMAPDGIISNRAGALSRPL